MLSDNKMIYFSSISLLFLFSSFISLIIIEIALIGSQIGIKIFKKISATPSSSFFIRLYLNCYIIKFFTVIARSETDSPAGEVVEL